MNAHELQPGQSIYVKDGKPYVGTAHYHNEIIDSVDSEWFVPEYVLAIKKPRSATGWLVGSLLALAMVILLLVGIVQALAMIHHTPECNGAKGCHFHTITQYYNPVTHTWTTDNTCYSASCQGG